MRTSILLIASLAACPASGAIYDVGDGSFDAPDDFVFHQTGTADSFMGTLTRKSGDFLITFDIGFMAGAHMSPERQERCLFFRESRINGHFACTGIEKAGEKTKITTTIYDRPEQLRRRKQALDSKNIPDLGKNSPAPANFWATIANDSDIVDFLLVTASYKPKESSGTEKRETEAPGNLLPFLTQCLADSEKVKAGMTRSKIEKLLPAAGGLSTASWGRYTHPQCPLLTVEVTFDVKPNATDGEPDDKATVVTKPTLGHFVAD
jgi:hypothetical protein